MARREPTIRIGTSGWQYAHWRGTVYPKDVPQRAWFQVYASRFSSVELNSTFYRMPDLSTFERWRAAAPPDFVYALKLGAFGSHRKKLRDAAEWLPNHVERARLLGPTLGPTLIQLPPRWRRNAARLDEMLSVAPADMRWAVELRDASWFHDDVFTVLERHGAALCIHDLLADHPFRMTAGWTYLRFHGPDALRHAYRGRYGGRRLAAVAERIESLRDDGCDVYCYFNNDDSGYAVADAAWLAERLGVTAPGAPVAS